MKKLLFPIIIMLATIAIYWFFKKENTPKVNTSMISRKELFSNPGKAAVRMSQDGQQVSYLSNLNGVLNIFIADIKTPEKASPITNDKDRGIRKYFWLADNEHIAYLKDDGGDENWRLHVVNTKTKQDKIFTPEKTTAFVYHVSKTVPDQILIGINDRDPAYHDVYRLNIVTGEKTLVYENKDEFRSFTFDDNYRLRFVSKTTAAGGSQYFKAIPTDLPRQYTWESFLEYGLEDQFTSGLLGLTHDGNTLYLLDSRNQDLNTLKSIDLKTTKSTIIAEAKQSEISSFMSEPITGKIQAYSINYIQNEWHFFDEKLKSDFDTIQKSISGKASILSRSLDDKTWIIADIRDDGPVGYYRYNRQYQQLTFMFHNKDNLINYKLSKMDGVEIPTRDGLTMISYLTKPLNTTQPMPLVVVVHGGPSLRDYWGYDPEAQWLASRGYAVLQINYRGSTGFGKKFKSAGDLEWGGKMHTDLLDGVNWAIKEGVADPKRVAIYGASYGGYAALWGATQSSDVFKCAVDLVGVSNLESFVKTVPPYWASYLEILYKQIGDPRTEEGQQLLKDRSPLTHVDKISIPVLVAQGEKDPRVVMAESEQIADAMKARNLEYLYLLFKDEGHGFARPENRLAFYGVVEQFLAEQLGGNAEPLTDELSKSTVIPSHIKTIKDRF